MGSAKKNCQKLVILQKNVKKPMKKTNSFLATCTLISKNVFIFVSSVDDFISLNFITSIFQNIP